MFKKIFTRISIVKEILRFFWDNKLWWMIPLIMVLVAFGILFIFAQGSVIGPFIYTLF